MSAYGIGDMDKRAELATLRQQYDEKLAWGGKCTRLGNRIATLEDELRPEWLRVIRRLGFWVFVLAYCGIFWLAIGAGIWQHLSPLIRSMMGQG